MLTRRQKRLDEQEKEVIREHKKVALKRDVDTRVHNQLLTQIEILKKGPDEELRRGEITSFTTMCDGWCLHEGRPEASQIRIPTSRGILMRESLLSLRKHFASRISWRWSGSRSMKTRCNLVVAQDPPSCGYLILLFQRRSHSTSS